MWVYNGMYHGMVFQAGNIPGKIIFQWVDSLWIVMLLGGQRWNYGEIYRLSSLELHFQVAVYPKQNMHIVCV